MKHKISFAGIDGSGKSTCLDLLISKLDSRCSKTILGTPYLLFKGDRNLVIKQGCFRITGDYRSRSREYRFYSIMEDYKPNTRKYRFYGVSLILNFVYKFLVSKYIEFFKKGDLIMYENDLLLHPLVYMAYHLPMTKMINKRLWFRIVSILIGSKRNVSIFYLDTEPEVAMERINKRGNDKNIHENTRDLQRLKKEFDDSVAMASEQGFGIIRINTNTQTLNEVVNEVQVGLQKILYASEIQEGSQVARN